MYLIDTNIFIEALLNQEKSADVCSFLKKVSFKKLFITDLSLHSIGIILFRFKKFDVFLSFLDDIVIDKLQIISLTPKELKALKDISSNFNIDFDDAYQYSTAIKYGLQLISFDKDFDKTDLTRKEPRDVLK